MYGQGNYAPQYRPPPPFQQPQPARPPPLPHFQQAPPGPSLPPAMPPGPLPHPMYQQPGPSYMPLPPQPYLQRPPPIRGNPPMPNAYNHPGTSYPPHPRPPPRMLPPPAPPAQGQGQPLYRTPHPPPPGIQHVLTPSPLAPPTFVRVMPATFTSLTQPPAGDAYPLSFPPPPPPPPPPSSPPPLPPSPPPPAPPTEEYPDAVPKVSPSGSRAHIADAPLDGVTVGKVGNSESRNPSVRDEAQVCLTSPPKPTEEEVVRNIEVLCDFIVNFGPDFENLARTKEAGNPKFAFLFGGKPGSAAAIGHEYFQWMKRKCLSEVGPRDDQEHNGSMLTIENVEGSSQLDKMEDQGAAVSPAASDMDMEDDIGQPYVDKGEQLLPEIAMSMTLSCTVPGLPLHDEEDDKDSQFLEDVSPVRASPDATVCASEKNAQGSIWMPPGESRMVKVSPTPSVGKTEEASKVYVKDGSPFRLIQGYASDNSEEDEKKETAEHNSIKFSPTARASASGMHQDRKSEVFSTFSTENIYTEETISNLPTDLSKKSSMKMSSEGNSIKRFPHKDTPPSAFCPSPVDVKKEVLGHGIFQQDDQKLDDRVGCERSQDNDISDADHQVGKQDSSTVDVDEFGRLVRKGASDSESDEKRSDERPLKRGRSRSRSPQDSRWRRRSRTPRRRDKRSRSRSRSPQRSRIKSPLPSRKSSVLGRRDRDQPPECFNFNRGRCFRGASCRFLHRDFTRPMSRQQQYKEYPRDSRKYDDHDAAAALSEPHKTAMTEMDVEGCTDAPQEEAKTIEVQVHTEQCDDSSRSHGAGDFEENDPCDSTAEDALTAKNEDTQVGDQASQEVVTCMEGPQQVEKVSKSPYSKFVEENRTQPFQSDQPLQADSMSFQPSPRGPIQPSQTTSTTFSEPQNFGEFSHGEESSSHPLPSQAIHPSSIHNQYPLTQSYPTIDKSSHAKEFPLSSISGTDFNYQVPPRPPGPHPPHFPPDNLNAPFVSQHPRNRFLPPSTNYQSQPPPMNFFSAHRPPIAGEHYSPNLPPANPVWSNMPPPPHSLSQVSNRPVLSTSDFPRLPQQNSMPPRYDFNPVMRPYSPGERGRPLGGDFHMDESRRRPLPMENRQDVPFAGEEQLLSPPMHEGSNIVSSWERDHHLRNQSFLREEVRRPSAGQGSASSSSFAQGDTVHPHSMPLPGESFPYRLHSFPAEQLNPRAFSREEFPTLAKDMPYSYHPPPYGQQQPASSGFTLNSGGSVSVDPSFQRHPSNFPEKPQQLSDIGMHRMPISSHYNSFASTFDQAPTSLKVGSGIAEHENDTNYSSRYDSSHMSGHVPTDDVVQRLTASPPNSAKSRDQFLSKSGMYLLEPNAQKQAVRESIVDDQYDPLFDSIESSSNASKKLDRAKEPNSGVIDAGTYPKPSSSHRSADGDENKGGAAAELRSDVDEYGEVATDAEVGDVDNASPQALDEKDWSPALPIGIINEAAGEIEIDRVQSPGKGKKRKDSRSMRVFKIALADFVKEILKPSWRQGNMSKEAFKTIVKKTVDKVSGAMSSHQIPKSQAKIHQYVESSQRKLTKLVMGYVNKYVKM